MNKLSLSDRHIPDGVENADLTHLGHHFGLLTFEQAQSLTYHKGLEMEGFDPSKIGHHREMSAFQHCGHV